MYSELKLVGFTERDIILLIKDRIKPKAKIGITQIKEMLKAIIQFEKDFNTFHKIINAYGDYEQAYGEKHE